MTMQCMSVVFRASTPMLTHGTTAPTAIAELIPHGARSPATKPIELQTLVAAVLQQHLGVTPDRFDLYVSKVSKAVSLCNIAMHL